MLQVCRMLMIVGIVVFPQFALGDDTLVYYQSSGELFAKGSPVVAPIAKGYSGAGEHRNKPASQCIGDLGPIPVGVYYIGSLADLTLPDGKVIPAAMKLTPAKENEMCKRKGFLMHGESISYPGWASAGCIILTKDERTRISKAGFSTLEVVRGK